MEGLFVAVRLQLFHDPLEVVFVDVGSGKNLEIRLFFNVENSAI